MQQRRNWPAVAASVVALAFGIGLAPLAAYADDFQEGDTRVKRTEDKDKILKSLIQTDTVGDVTTISRVTQEFTRAKEVTERYNLVGSRIEKGTVDEPIYETQTRVVTKVGMKKQSFPVTHYETRIVEVEETRPVMVASTSVVLVGYKTEQRQVTQSVTKTELQNKTVKFDVRDFYHAYQPNWSQSTLNQYHTFPFSFADMTITVADMIYRWKSLGFTAELNKLLGFDLEAAYKAGDLSTNITRVVSPAATFNLFTGWQGYDTVTLTFQKKATVVTDEKKTVEVQVPIYETQTIMVPATTVTEVPSKDWTTVQVATLVNGVARTTEQDVYGNSSTQVEVPEMETVIATRAIQVPVVVQEERDVPYSYDEEVEEQVQVGTRKVNVERVIPEYKWQKLSERTVEEPGAIRSTQVLSTTTEKRKAATLPTTSVNTGTRTSTSLSGYTTTTTKASGK